MDRILMKLHFNSSLSASYKNPAQKIRVMSEDWAEKNLY